MTISAVQRLTRGSKDYWRVRQSLQKLDGNPETLTLLYLPYVKSRVLTVEQLVELEDVSQEYFKRQTCLATPGEVRIDTFFKGMVLSGAQRVHLFAHLAHRFIGELVMDQTATHLEDRIIFTKNRRSVIAVYTAALWEKELAITASLVWYQLDNFLKGYSYLPTFDEMRHQIAAALLIKPKTTTTT